MNEWNYNFSLQKKSVIPFERNNDYTKDNKDQDIKYAFILG